MTDVYIPYSTQDIDDDDIAAVTEVLKSRFVTQGPAIERFEKAIVDYCQVPHAVAVSSGTAGIHIALAALEVDRDSLVWTSPITFVGTANAARMLGAGVSFIDIDKATGNIDTAALAEKLDAARRDNILPDVLVVVHFAGRACDMETIHSMCRQHNIAIIEDAAHALGSQYDDSTNVGHSHFCDASVFSFHPVKAITTGEGGMVTTRRADLAKRLRRLRSHGVSRNREDFIAPAQSTDEHGDWYYEQLELGYNYRITDIQAALGASQMTRLDDFIKARRALAERYSHLLDGLPLHLPPPSAHSAWHLYILRLAECARLSRRALFDALRAANIGVNVHYIPVHLQPYYRDLGFEPGDYPESEAYYAGAVTVPLYPKLTEDQQNSVVAVIRQALA